MLLFISLFTRKQSDYLRIQLDLGFEALRHRSRRNTESQMQLIANLACSSGLLELNEQTC
ncbi:hypothetical protein D3C78_1834190 [compost metagenome]